MEKYASDEKPWIFLCATAFLEYLARMVVNKTNQKDAVVFIAEDFVGDIKKLVEEIFRKTVSDKKLKSNIKNYFNRYPPIFGEVK